MQVSSSSAAPWAPYATSENVPKPRDVSYRPKAPFSTSADVPKSPSAPIPRRHTFTSSVQAPYGLHDDIPTGRPVTPPSRTASVAGFAGPRPSTAQSLPPFDNDYQPAPLPPRPRIRMAVRARDTCPYDTTPDEKPPARTAPIATYALLTPLRVCISQIIAR